MYASILRRFVAVFVAMVLPASVFALPEVPEEKGWSGFVGVGAGYLNFKSNTVAGSDVIDLDNDRLSPNDLNDSPSSRSTAIPAILGEVRWTLGRRNQLFLGTSEERAVSLDGGTALGWRKGTDNAGTFEVAGVFNTAIPVELYEDPFQTGNKREKTDSERNGLRLTWDRIFNTGFEAQLLARQIDVDKERSGQSLVGTDPGLGGGVVTQADLRLLEREADEVAVRVAYRFNFGEGGSIRPLLSFKKRDADGDAESFDSIRAQLTYNWQNDKGNQFVTNLSFGQRDFDKRNPIYNEYRDSDTLAIDATLFVPLPYENWRLFANVLWGDEDSDIDFYDQTAFRAAAGAEWRF